MTGRALAVDLGASSGRVIAGSFDGKRIALEEVHRFENNPVQKQGTLYWDTPRLYSEILSGLAKAGEFDSLAFDTWGVDFGLVGGDGELLEMPVHYRDGRTAGMPEKAFELMDKGRLYQLTGNQIMEINTAFQLLSLKLNRHQLLEQADKMLLMPDLFCYMLTGEKRAELSIASTTQLLDARNRTWSDEVLSALGLPKKIFPEVVQPGTVAGTINNSICREWSIPAARVVSVCGHDTQSAIAAVPCIEDDFIFISCGTWSLFGTELPEPLINEKSARLNITNEIGYGGKADFLKNITGLWLIQESRRQFRREGREYSFADMERLARAAKPFVSFIDTDAPEFAPVGDIPGRVAEYCKKTGQPFPEGDGGVIRCLYESLALKYRRTLEEIQDCTGKKYDKIYLVGGGARDSLLCQMTANACGCTVYAGPVEATAYGNIAVQLISRGEISGIAQAREIIGASESVKTFRPADSAAWDEAYGRYQEYCQE